jgi:hypothetical protein
MRVALLGTPSLLVLSDLLLALDLRWREVTTLLVRRWRRCRRVVGMRAVCLAMLAGTMTSILVLPPSSVPHMDIKPPLLLPSFFFFFPLPTSSY